MNPVDRDDVVHALTQVQAFYGKELDELAVKLWIRAIQNFDPKAVKQALADYPSRGKYAPKPRDIIEIVEERRQEQSRKTAALPEPMTTNCPPEIAKAWIWFIGLVASTGTNELVAGAMPRTEISLELQDRYLNLVNHEARRLGTPESVPDEFKLPEVWGDIAA